MLMALFMESIYPIVGFPLFLLPSTFPSLIFVFFQEPCFLLKCLSSTACFVTFASSNVSGLICSRTHLFIFPVAQGFLGAPLQYYISKESFFPISLVHCPTFIVVQSHWVYKDVDNCSLGLQQHIFALGYLS